jgi:hypothetical protein
VITRPCYANRDDVKRALDFEVTQVDDLRIDRALQSEAEAIDGGQGMRRFFYPVDATVYLDWPNYQYAYPWRYWFDQAGYHDLWVMTSLQSPSGVAVPLWQVFLEPVNRKQGWPFTRMDLDRSTVAAWGAGPTPQHSIWAAGTWGWYNPQPAGTITAAINSSVTTITVSDGSQAGAGDLLVVNPGTSAAPFPAYPGTAGALGALSGERVIVTGKSTAATGLTQSGPGCSTASGADNALSTTGSGSLNVGEVLLLGTEQMLVTDITGGVATVKRGWNGTVLAAHSSAAVSAYRALSVLRGQLGTTAASATSGTAVSKHNPPGLIRDLNLAGALNRVLQETSGYARTAGAGEAQVPVSGAGLAALWAEARATFGRTMRVRAV